MDRDFLTTDQYKNAELKTYTSITTLSVASGVPKKLLTTAKKKGCVGFNTNGNVNWAKAKIPFEAMLDVLNEQMEDDIAFWNKENKKKDVALKDLQIKKLERNLIEPEDVKSLLVELATAQSVMMKRIFSELPPKVAGKGEPDCKIILDDALKDIFSVLNHKIENWK